MFRIISLIVTVLLMAYLALHIYSPGKSSTSTNGSADGTTEVQSNPAGAIPKAKDAVQKDSNYTDRAKSLLQQNQ